METAGSEQVNFAPQGVFHVVEETEEPFCRATIRICEFHEQIDVAR